MNIIETRAVLNIVKTDGKWVPEEGKREGLDLIIHFYVSSFLHLYIFSDSIFKLVLKYSRVQVFRYLSVHAFKQISVSVFNYFSVLMLQFFSV